MKRRFFIFFYFVLLLVTFVSCDPNKLHDGQKVVILSVGLDYKNTNVATLNGTINDAKEVGMALKSLYDNRNIDCELIYMLQEGSDADMNSTLYPTSNNVLEQIKKLNLDSDDLFIFYYAGHGETGSLGSMFLACGKKVVTTGSTTITYSYTELSMIGLQNQLMSLPCRSVVILDSCHSGMMDTLNEFSPNTWSDSLSSLFDYSWNNDGKISVLASAAARNTASDGVEIIFDETHKENHGDFTTILLSYLGWNHSCEDYSTHENSDGSKVIVYGCSSGLKGSLTLEELYKSVMKSNLPQKPKLFGTTETINIIPAN